MDIGGLEHADSRMEPREVREQVPRGLRTRQRGIGRPGLIDRRCLQVWALGYPSWFFQESMAFTNQSDMPNVILSLDIRSEGLPQRVAHPSNAVVVPTST